MKRFLVGLVVVAITLGIPIPANAATRKVMSHRAVQSVSTVFSHSGYGNYTSGSKKVRSGGSMRVSYDVKCRTTNSGFNFMYLLFTGSGSDSEQIDVDFTTKNAHGTDTMVPFDRHGTFRIWTQPNCKVVVNATQTR